MTMFNRRTFASAALLAIAMLGQPCPAEVRAQDNWQDRRDDLGGWLDLDTGLVWGQDFLSYFRFSCTWDGANNLALPMYRLDTDNPAWRLPTVAELQEASAKGGYELLIVANGSTAGSSWSSQTQGKRSAYSVNLRNGVPRLLDKRSGINVVPVYRVFVP